MLRDVLPVQNAAESYLQQAFLILHFSIAININSSQTSESKKKFMWQNLEGQNRLLHGCDNMTFYVIYLFSVHYN